VEIHPVDSVRSAPDRDAFRHYNLLHDPDAREPLSLHQCDKVEPETVRQSSGRDGLDPDLCLLVENMTVVDDLKPAQAQLADELDGSLILGTIIFINPGNHIGGALVNVLHGGHLGFALWYIILVDADGVDPEPSGSVGELQTSEGIVEVLSD